MFAREVMRAHPAENDGKAHAARDYVAMFIAPPSIGCAMPLREAERASVQQRVQAL